jgi:hypothetical protein
MIHPLLAGDLISARHSELLREAQHQRLARCLPSNRPTLAVSLRASAQAALIALGIRPILERRAAAQPPILCDCYID